MQYDVAAREMAKLEQRQSDERDETALRRLDRQHAECRMFIVGSVAAGVVGGFLVLSMGWLMTRRRSATCSTGRMAVSVAVLSLGFSLFLVYNYHVHCNRILGRDAAKITKAEKAAADQKAVDDKVRGEGIVSRFLGVDVGLAQTNHVRTVRLPRPLGPFEQGVMESGPDGQVREIHFSFTCAAFEDMNSAVRRVEALLPEIYARLDCKCPQAETTEAGHRWWAFLFNSTSQGMAQIYVAPEKKSGVPQIIFSIRREMLDHDMPEPKRYLDAERVKVPKEPPQGDIGDGQDEKWVRATYPEHADMILKKGYENWLSEWVGVNVNNNHYKAIIHVGTITNGTCELICGPYRVHVTKPGRYSFALEHLESYDMHTEPHSELRIFADSGYRGPGASLEDITEASKRKGAEK